METDLSPDKILPRAIDIYTNKTKINIKTLMVLGFFAGAFVSLAAEASTLAASSLLADKTSFAIGKLVQGLVFTPGLIFILLAGGELFTGNCLMTIPLLEKKINLKTMIRSWILVYFANFIGALSIAFLLYASGQWFFADGLVGVRTILIAKSKIDFSFVQALILGLLGNFLVCLGVWMSLGARSYGSKVLSAFFPISIFVLSGFEHSIANMYYLPAGILAKNIPDLASKSGLGEGLASLNISNMVFKNLLPVTLGNMIGGAIFVGILYYFAYRTHNKD
ncbi:formate/nitrite transporter family protein [uncultured Anaerococcus sp.]|uniref:formate/nitrite transporter family protein n=1 Tax=uncultured Anaerococcus sp. TaxID=293428 RepID=UPI002889C504|nr:formate/nitrite transporter family protein [uncultured Anaerococcus sp.]